MIIGRCLNRVRTSIDTIVSKHIIREDKAFLACFGDRRLRNRKTLTMREMHNVYKLVEQSGKLRGDLAEVGVYRGGSARIICEFKGQRNLHLFDTFAGMPMVDKRVDRHRQGDFADTSIEAVQAFLSGFQNVYYHKGCFPETANAVLNCTFSMVHIDVDIYKSTLDCLRFFYPRMTRGGFILSHDYRTLLGVRKAFADFFADKPEQILELWDTQCLVAKT